MFTWKITALPQCSDWYERDSSSKCHLVFQLGEGFGDLNGVNMIAFSWYSICKWRSVCTTES